MSEVYSVLTQIAPARITTGHYIIENERLVMTFPDGKPVDADRFSALLRPGDDPEAIARVLTKKVRTYLMGFTEEEDAFFNRDLVYEKIGRA